MFLMYQDDALEKFKLPTHELKYGIVRLGNFKLSLKTYRPTNGSILGLEIRTPSDRTYLVRTKLALPLDKVAKQK